jgi:glucan phosphoethanolaminetransferase (alkaline phosphatase superfamily)
MRVTKRWVAKPNDGLSSIALPLCLLFALLLLSLPLLHYLSYFHTVMALGRFSLLCLALIALVLVSSVPRNVRAQEEDEASVARSYSPEEIAAQRAAQQQAGYIEADTVFPDHADTSM